MPNATPQIIHHAEHLAQQEPQAIVSVYDTLTETCCWASPSHADIMGHEPDGMIDQSWRAFVSSGDHDHAALAGTDALLNGQSVEFGFRAVTASGQPVPMRGVAWIEVDRATGMSFMFFKASPIRH